jgi:hypothetical protein
LGKGSDFGFDPDLNGRAGGVEAFSASHNNANEGDRGNHEQRAAPELDVLP